MTKIALGKRPDDDTEKDGRPLDWEKVEGFNPILTLAAFLGGLTFAGMIMIIQEGDKFNLPLFTSVGLRYSELLVAGTGLESALFILTAFVSTTIASGGEKNQKQRDLGILLATVGVFGIIVLIPAILVVFTPLGALVIAMAEGIVLFKMLRIPSISEEVPVAADRPPSAKKVEEKEWKDEYDNLMK